VTVGKSPVGIAADPAAHKVYVANSDSNTVSVIDTTSDKVVANVTVGKSPFRVAIDPFDDKVYVANRDSNTVSVIDTTSDKVVARVRFSISPSVDSGHIKCGTKDVPTNLDVELESYTRCTAVPNSGFKFSSWTENLGHNSTKTISTSTLSNSPIDAVTSALGFLPADDGSILNVSDFGNFTANFKQVPPPIPSEYWIPLYGIIISTVVGWSIPSVIGWIKAKKEGGKVRKHNLAIKSLYDDGKVDEMDIPILEKLKDDITDDFAKGKINEQHYNNLNNTLSILYEEIYKKKIDLLNGKGTNGALLDKIKDDINDSYAKGKINEQHYKLLNEKLCGNKNNQQPNNNNHLTPSSQRSILLSTTQGCPIKS
jgi:YVTN family beta-propeller protein